MDEKENYEAIEDHPGYIIKNEKAKWEIEAKEAFATNKNSPEECIYWGPFLNGYIAAKRLELEGKIEGLEKHPKLELAFQHQRFSGIVVNNRLIEEGEVIDYIKGKEARIKVLENAMSNGCHNVQCLMGKQGLVRKLEETEKRIQSMERKE